MDFQIKVNRVENPPIESVTLTLPYETAEAICYALGPLVGKAANESGLIGLWNDLLNTLGISMGATLHSLEAYKNGYMRLTVPRKYEDEPEKYEDE